VVRRKPRAFCVFRLAKNARLSRISGKELHEAKLQFEATIARVVRHPWLPQAAATDHRALSWPRVMRQTARRIITRGIAAGW
jgi:hypothetical protein